MDPQLNLDPNPPRPGPTLWIFRLKGAEMKTFLCLSRGIFGIWTHWMGRASAPCFADPLVCPGCKNLAPKRWKGYINVHCYEARRNGFFELTPVTSDNLLSMYDQGGSLRGERFNVSRGKGDKARLKVQPLQSHQDLSSLPEEVSPEGTLRALWNISALAELWQPDVRLAQ